jgi:probable rRNA maturation factor
MTIHFEYEGETELDFDYKQLVTKVVNETLDYEQCPYETELNIIFTTNEEIHLINKEYRGIDSSTDVLSFPMIDYENPSDFSVVEAQTGIFFNPESGELLLGDIILSIDKITEQADNYGHSKEREMAFLIAHSVLHLCGYDHILDEDRAIMEEKQKIILNNLNILRND